MSAGDGLDLDAYPAAGHVAGVLELGHNRLGTAMVLDDEIIRLRSRVDRLQRSLRFIDEPVATALIKGVIAEMEARIAEFERLDGNRDVEGVKAP
jgi:hypothetical protein